MAAVIVEVVFYSLYRTIAQLVSAFQQPSAERNIPLWTCRLSEMKEKSSVRSASSSPLRLRPKLNHPTPQLTRARPCLSKSVHFNPLQTRCSLSPADSNSIFIFRMPQSVSLSASSNYPLTILRISSSRKPG